MHVYYLYICTDVRIWTFFFWMPFASWSEEFSSPVLLFILLNRHANEWQVFFSFDLKFQMKFEFCSSHQILLDLHWAWLCLVLFLEQKRKNINNIRLVGETWTCNFKCRSFCLQFKFNLILWLRVITQRRYKVLFSLLFETSCQISNKISHVQLCSCSSEH